MAKTDKEMLRSVLRSYLQPIPKLYAVHVNSGQASFLKHYDYYVSEGGNTQKWGKHWRIVLALNEGAVRLFAIERMGARSDGLFCSICGEEKHGPCNYDKHVPAIEVPREIAAEEWERARKGRS